MSEVGRESLLNTMYEQMFSNINRHITMVWSSTGVVIGSFAILSFVQQKLLSIDLAVSLILLLLGWMIAHVIDGNHWFNRNLLIIANIERALLRKDDLKNIHFFFEKHRQNNEMITHFRIQFWFGIVLALVVLGYHFYHQVRPLFCNSDAALTLPVAAPYLVALFLSKTLYDVARDARTSYQELVERSPGTPFDSSSSNA